MAPGVSRGSVSQVLEQLDQLVVLTVHIADDVKIHLRVSIMRSSAVEQDRKCGAWRHFFQPLVDVHVIPPPGTVSRRSVLRIRQIGGSSKAPGSPIAIVG